MMKTRILILILGVLFSLAACQTQATPVVVQEGAAETQTAATEFYAGQTATAEAAATIAAAPTDPPTPTPEPFVRPTDDPAVDPETVIASVAGHDITVEEFRSRVRYERWSALETLHRVAESSGIDVLDIRDPQNPMTPTIVGYIYTLSEAESFAEQVLDFMLQERIIYQEFLAREMELPADLVNNIWARLVNLEPTADGTLPEDFDETLDSFMETLHLYTDISEVELRFLITAQSVQEMVAQAIGREVDYDPMSIDTQLIVVETQAEAEEIVDLLAGGADFESLAVERSIAQSARGNGGALGLVERGVTVPAFEEAAFAAPLNEIVGPVETQFGFHLILVTERFYEVRSRQILLETEEDALAALDRLEAGEDFADLVLELSIDPDAESNEGDLGFVGAGETPEAYEAAIADAEIGEIVGPVETSFGFHVIEVTDRRVSGVVASHILVETEAEALAALERIEADGEDFAAVASEVTIDPAGQGNRGNQGILTSDQLPEALFDALKRAEDGEVVGPIETEAGYVVARPLEREVNILTPEQADEIQGLHFQSWLLGRIREIEVNEIWREVYPSDPQPGDIAPYLGELQQAVDEALAAFTPQPQMTEIPTEG